MLIRLLLLLFLGTEAAEEDAAREEEALVGAASDVGEASSINLTFFLAPGPPQ
jgi:hypothetical protein